MTLHKTLIATALFSTMAFTGVAHAESPACGDPQDDSWMAEADLLEKVQGMGYAIDTLAISEGNCYELTGTNSTGESVVTYLDPRTGDIVEEAVQ